MKTYLKYGGAMAGIVFVIVLVLYLLGLHSDASKLGTARWIQGGFGLAVTVAGIVLGTKERRAVVPATEEFGYGQALGAGVMITLFASLIGTVTTLLYVTVINPDMTDIALQAQIAKWEAAGMSGARMEQAEAMMRKMMHPAIQACVGFVFGMLFGTIVSLITSAFLKRDASGLPPAAT